MGTLVQVPKDRIFPLAVAMTLVAAGCTSSNGNGSNGGSSSNSGSNTIAEKCTNGIDDDGDGKSDCADDDCSAGLDCVGRSH